MSDFFDCLTQREEEETKVSKFDDKLKEIDIQAFNEYFEMLENIEKMKDKDFRENTTNQEYKVMKKDINNLKHKDRDKVIEILELLNRDDYLLMEILKTYKRSLDLKSVGYFGDKRV